MVYHLNPQQYQQVIEIINKNPSTSNARVHLTIFNNNLGKNFVMLSLANFLEYQHVSGQLSHENIKGTVNILVNTLIDEEVASHIKVQMERW